MATITTSTMDLSSASLAYDGYLPRSKSLPFWFIPPAAMAFASWMGGGVPFLTDLSFVLLTVVCGLLLALEFYHFPRRFGVGAMLIFGGYLTWYCYDYLKHWMGVNFSNGDAAYPAVVIAKTAFYHIFFIFGCAIGLLLPTGRRPIQLINSIPEPNQTSFYFALVLAIFAFGISPYFLFTVEPWYVSIYKDIFAARWHGAAFTMGRTGRLNFSWGGYLPQVMDVGKIGGQLAVFYAVLLTRNVFQKIICWAIWTLWLLLAFGTGTRGAVAFMVLPVIAIVYLKYQAWAVMMLKKISVRAYVYGAVMLFGLVVMVQIQGRYRTIGYSDVEIKNINVLELNGNAMFSEGLGGWALIPEHVPYISNRFPGEALIRPIPETIWNLCYKIVPRALWHNKPLDPVEEWYNNVATNGRNDATISTGVVGEWFFRYGPLGMIQGAILFGWLARVGERGLQTAGGRTMALFLSLALETFLFRAFRNFNYQDFYPIVLGGVAFYILVSFTNQMSPKAGPQPSG